MLLLKEGQIDSPREKTRRQKEAILDGMKETGVIGICGAIVGAIVSLIFGKVIGGLIFIGSVIYGGIDSYRYYKKKTIASAILFACPYCEKTVYIPSSEGIYTCPFCKKNFKCSDGTLYVEKDW